jgi:AcrR family transcriptional regulator
MTTTPTRRSQPRERLLRTASQLFYAKGIHSVGVDEIVERAQVTRSTLYRHFAGKDGLIVAYLETASALERQQVAAVLADLDEPEARLRAVADVVAASIHNPAFRGCAFLNAAAEYPDATHPVRRAVTEHRTWFHSLVAGLVDEVAGRPAPELADLFVLMRDGAMASACLTDPDEVIAVFRTGAAGVVESARR